jgi:hypothetical protein
MRKALQLVIWYQKVLRKLKGRGKLWILNFIIT